MNHNDVQLIGVFGTKDQPMEGFVYSRNAPTNLWVGALCTDGSRMGHEFMAFVVNELIDNDRFAEGDRVEMDNQDGTHLVATVGAEVPKDDVEAYGAMSPTVRVVSVAVES